MAMDNFYCVLIQEHPQNPSPFKTFNFFLQNAKFLKLKLQFFKLKILEWVNKGQIKEIIQVFHNYSNISSYS